MKPTTIVADDTSTPCSRTELQPASNDGEKANGGECSPTVSLTSPAAVPAQPSARPTLLESFRYWAMSRS
jgi:hypothetical protein